MTEQVKIDLQDNSPYRVALELAFTIARAEGRAGGMGSQSADRKYWLDLYERCRKVVVSGWETSEALKGSAVPE